MEVHQKSKPFFMKRLSTVALLGAVFMLAGSGTAFAATPILHAQQSPQAPNSGVASNLSRNWSGYVAQNGTYTGVTGTWVVPTVPATQSASADATWVGIGGMTTNDLIQAGTQTITQNGQLLYQAWYEILPNVSVPISSLSIAPGNQITTTLHNQGGNSWLITIENDTTGQIYSTTVTYASSESSAEWIEEMPADQNGYVPLDSFGSIPFTGADAVFNGVNENLVEIGAQPLTMTSGQQVLSVPTAIGNDDQSFTVDRTTSSSTVAPQTIIINRGGFSRSPHGNQGFSYASSTTQSDGNGGQITRSIRYFVIPLTQASTTQQGSVGTGQDFQYSVGNGTISVQWSF
jgi:Peptidase A4 family